MSLPHSLLRHLERLLDVPNLRSIPVAGGCIHQSYRLDSPSGTFFLKCNTSDHLSAFETEAMGLEEIQRTQTIRCPKPHATGIHQDLAWVLMEFIPFEPAPPYFEREFGTAMARLHQTSSPTFGWHRPNTLGATPQMNSPHPSWLDFLRENRLQFQFQLAEKNGLQIPESQYLLDRLPDFFQDYTPQPSLLHGDLWSGNFGWSSQGNPVIFDPAVYFGDREMEFGLITLFGGLSPGFFQAYQVITPLDPGFTRRKPLYALYHALNHYNLFGATYASSVRSLMSQVLHPKA